MCKVAAERIIGDRLEWHYLKHFWPVVYPKKDRKSEINSPKFCSPLCSDMNSLLAGKNTGNFVIIDA